MAQLETFGLKFVSVLEDNPQKYVSVFCWVQVRFGFKEQVRLRFREQFQYSFTPAQDFHLILTFQYEKLA